MENFEYDFEDDATLEFVTGFAESDRKIRDFRDLKVWQKSMSFVVDVYELTSSFPKEELYGLTSQMRRSAVSIPSNLAEGYGRSTTKAYVHFVRIALGSAKELETQLEISSRLRFASHDRIKSLVESANEISKMLYALGKSLERNPRC